MKVGIYPGSFDPITNGHLDIIQRASNICDEVVVSVLMNPSKNPLFSLEERVELIKEVVKPFPNVKVDCFSGLLVDYLKAKDAKIIIKGLRAVSDFEYEFQMALMNKKLNKTKETMFMMTNSKYSYLSSTAIKQVALFKGHLEGLIPSELEEEIRERAKKFKGE